jgi:3-methyladenine DNA glycosylase/8-oxoguanine DNA glycosylase
MTTTTRELPVPQRYDLARSLGVLSLGHDPAARVSATEVWWPTRTPDGPATLHLRLHRTDSRLSASAYGPGAGWVIDRADAIAGLRDDLTGFAELSRAHPVVEQLARQHSGVRLPATGRLFQHLVPTVLSQKVTGLEAKRSYTKLVRHLGEAAPGPGPAGLLLPPDPAAVATMPYWSLHPFGVEQKRADALVRVAALAESLERCPDPASATKRLLAIPGIGVWTAAEAVRVAFGDPDAVTVGDYHLPNVVAWALAGEARATDDRMLQLLEPFTGHRARVVDLLRHGGIGAPRFGPRMPIRSFARF